MFLFVLFTLLVTATPVIGMQEKVKPQNTRVHLEKKMERYQDFQAECDHLKKEIQHCYGLLKEESAKMQREQLTRRINEITTYGIQVAIAEHLVKEYQRDPSGDFFKTRGGRELMCLLKDN